MKVSLVYELRGLPSSSSSSSLLEKASHCCEGSRRLRQPLLQQAGRVELWSGGCRGNVKKVPVKQSRGSSRA